MSNDRNLGMDRRISRRDFVNGASVAIGALGLPGAALAQQSGAAAAQSAYPPARTGMRGSHPGSFESAHGLRDGTLDIASARDVDQTYDLVVVGGGLSGLAAAHFFLKDVGRDARVLILENHDDFGGHAKRNEFRVDGKMVVVNGGTLNIESPGRYNRWAKQVLTDIGVDVDRYETANTANRGLYSSKGLKSGYFFDKETWGRDRLVVGGGGRGSMAPDMIARTPLSQKAKDDLLRLVGTNHPDYFPGLTPQQKFERLAKMSYLDYLLNVVKVDRQATWFFQTYGHGSFCVGADATPALFAAVDGLPGFSGLGLPPMPEGLLADLPGGHHGRQKPDNRAVHFPDGNATVARLLVKTLIPEAVDGKSQEDMGLALVDYGQLDVAGHPARIRLNSTVVNVKHDGDVAAAKEAVVTYIQGGALQRVRGKAVIMACWNMFIPYLMPELPAAQREALAYGVKGPLIYTSVAIRNWRAFEKLGVSRVNSPTSFHEAFSLTEAATLGGLKHAQTPDEPVAIHMEKIMAKPGLPRRDQHRVGRAELLEISFETFERNIRSQLARTLGAGGFDPARDIAGISVNRWPHGYAYTYNSLYDPLEWVFTQSDKRPCVVGRQPYGLVSIANSDAAASPHTDAAFLEAHRAVSEVVEKRVYPFARV